MSNTLAHFSHEVYFLYEEQKHRLKMLLVVTFTLHCICIQFIIDNNKHCIQFIVDNNKHCIQFIVTIYS